MANYKVEIEDYVDPIIKNDMPDKIMKLMDGNITLDDINEINKYWIEMMAPKTICFYYWMLTDPKLNSSDEESNKKKAWEMFPGLAINYDYKTFKWTIICFGKYYILEASFPH
jgi:hypothetical protein